MNASRGNQAYTIIATLHRSARHITYQAKNFFTSLPVVIKTPETQWKHDPGVNADLKQEADICARLEHPNIRKVQGVFEEDGVAYLVADYIEGKPLTDYLGNTRSTPSTDAIIKWLREMLEALVYAHSQGLAHHNIDPSNVLIDSEGHAIIIAFGAADNVSDIRSQAADTFHPALFKAPELWYQDPPAANSDLYSLAALGYALLCQRMPWSIDSRLDPAKQKEQSLTRPVLDPELLGRNVPRWLFTVLRKALMPHPGDRFADAKAMLEALLAETELHTSPARPYTAVNKAPYMPIPSPPELPVPPVETPAPEPDIPQPSAPAEAPKEVEPTPQPAPVPPPIPKASPKTQPKPLPEQREHKPARMPWTSILPQDTGPEADPDMARLRKTSLILGGLSILVLIFVFGKYVIFKERPVLDILEDVEEEEVVEEAPRVTNKAIKMVQVPGDSIVIGSVSPGADEDEYPTLRLKVPDFMISPHEITNEQWSMAYPDYYYPDGDDNKPVVNVSFLEVLEYCNAKSVKDGLDPCYVVGNNYSCDYTSNGYRLPTEAEWEYAAKYTRDGKTTIYSGSDNADDVAWHKNNSNGELRPVGRKDKNDLGLYDMSGNASEWVWNWYASYAMSGNTFEGPYSGTDKVIRGGSFTHLPKEARVSNRAYLKPFARSPFVGFRLVRSK